MKTIYISNSEAKRICEDARKMISVLRKPDAIHFNSKAPLLDDIENAVKSIEEQYMEAQKLSIAEENVVICISSVDLDSLVRALGKENNN